MKTKKARDEYHPYHLGNTFLSPFGGSYNLVVRYCDLLLGWAPWEGDGETMAMRINIFSMCCIRFCLVPFISFFSLCLPLIHPLSRKIQWGLVLNRQVFLQLFRGGFAEPPKRPGVSQASLLGKVCSGLGATVARRGQQKMTDVGSKNDGFGSTEMGI